MASKVVAQRLAVKYNPPTIALIYTRSDDPTKQQLIREMQLVDINPKSNLPQLCEHLFKAHAQFLPRDQISPDQIMKLLIRIKDNLFKKEEEDIYADVDGELNNSDLDFEAHAEDEEDDADFF
mmetsp:Transcript_42469/g.48802  ORF Transcript_42469/g.48802 Transcript_42469/m.48802 type:complete len:123 (+) Transcript_42469:64-432(+)